MTRNPAYAVPPPRRTSESVPVSGTPLFVVPPSGGLERQEDKQPEAVRESPPLHPPIQCSFPFRLKAELRTQTSGSATVSRRLGLFAQGLASVLSLAFLILAATLPQPASACQVPVFRYALERWEADPFILQVAHTRPLPGPLEKRLGELQKELESTPPPVNLELEVLDLGNLTDEQKVAVPGLDLIQNDPAILLHPPKSWGDDARPLVFDANVPTIDRILDSPARRRCVEDLLAGQSAVWFLVESSDKSADDQAFQTLKAALKRAEKEIEIPEGIHCAEDAESLPDNVNLEDVLRSSIPLKISFKIERLCRDDPAEQVFLKLLAGPAGQWPEGPAVVPVFGRGRSLGPAPAADLPGQRIIDACAYLCGACSCQVKSGNPGYDILFRAPWSEHLQEGLVVIDKELPPLPGVGQIDQKAPPADLDNDLPSAPSPNDVPPIPPLWWVGGGVLALVLVGGSFLILRSKRSG